MMLSGDLGARLGDVKCWLSLSHEGDYALAFVVLEKR
jgi:phosphopantetheinyl transferase (holo-ACP synthase)